MEKAQVKLYFILSSISLLFVLLILLDPCKKVDELVTKDNFYVMANDNVQQRTINSFDNTKALKEEGKAEYQCAAGLQSTDTFSGVWSESESESENQNEADNDVDMTIADVFEHQNRYPTELIELLQRNPLTLQYVLDYEKNKDKDRVIDLSDALQNDEVPLYLQWDERWGYKQYGDTMIGINGCGPTCMSMVATYLLKNTDLNPLWMANFSEENGYITINGTAWKFMNEGALKLGLKSQQVALVERKLKECLEEGKLIICSMGPGTFTQQGHFIVLVGYEDGQFKINDPNNPEYSRRLWNFDEFSNQVKNLWVYSALE